MGKIIFEFPENINKKIKIYSVKQIKNLIKIFEDKKSPKVFEKLLKYRGKAKNKSLSQEELHLQEDK